MQEIKIFKLRYSLINKIFLSLTLITMITFPRSFIMLKLTFIIFFLLINLIYQLQHRSLKLSKYLVVFYAILMIISGIWSFIGLLNGATIEGFFSNFRLMFIWSFAYLILFTIFINIRFILNRFHNVMLVSAFLIAFINISLFIDQIFILNVVPINVIEELNFRFGIHDNYIQITSHNIGSLFFVVPYLLTCFFFYSPKLETKRLWLFIVLFLSLIVALLSGRRALWLVIAFTPFIIIVYAYFTRNLYLLNKKFILSSAISALLFFIIVVYSYQIDFISHIQNAFSATDERSIQKPYLIDKFFEYFFFGTGYGIPAEYIRSSAQPWMYELTYHQMLLNYGIIGILIIVLLVSSFFVLSVTGIKKTKNNKIIMLGMLVGLSTFLIGLYSNPYLSSFDFLLYLGILPLLASFNNNKISYRVNG